ncbi:MAG: hypothetical protein ACJ768_19225 [Gaiellaceae bacterium]
MHRFPRPSPALFISLLALFFALGGTALAIGEKSVPQARCQTGAVRGIAVVTPGQEGLDSLPSTYTSDGAYFGYRWSCTGGQISIRKPRDFAGVEVYFDGNPADVAILQSTNLGVPNAGSVHKGSDGGFYISMGGANTGVPGPWEVQWNVPFTIVLM